MVQVWRDLWFIPKYIQTKYTTMTTWELIEDSQSTLICGKLLRQMSFCLSIIGLARGLLVRDWINNNEYKSVCGYEGLVLFEAK